MSASSPKNLERAAVLLDFDGTITTDDVLNRLLEDFSIDDRWMEWEAQWERGELGTTQCLTRQLDGVRISETELALFLSGFSIDPAFSALMALISERKWSFAIVSDSMEPFIEAILERHGFAGLPVYANRVRHEGERLTVHFPYTSDHCSRCAHCKSIHVRAYQLQGIPVVYVGDGLSDRCAASRSDFVFAKNGLRKFCLSQAIPHHPIQSLTDVLEGLQ